ncbi:hypothetical protein V2J09_015143 [Rumex salicifolius]
MYLRQATASFLRRVRFQSKVITNPCTGSRQEFLAPIFEKSRSHHQHGRLFWLFISAQPALLFGIGSSPVLADENSTGLPPEKNVSPDMTGLQKIEDGSGKVDEAEKLFLSAIEEAKKGFGERDPHVASSYNNLAELYRIRKLYDKAEPLYRQAIDLLKESFGDEDVRVGAALHNLGQFYLVQRKLEEAQACYELKGRVLGHGHTDYADTMYHLGTVLYLLGKEKDAEAFIEDSIRILEEAGQGESHICLRRLRYLAQSNRLEEAEIIQRKALHIMELMKGWNTMDTVIYAESLAMTLQASGKLDDAQDLCLDVRKTLLPKNHIQIGANMLSLGKLIMLKAHELKKLGASKAISELERARDLLKNSSRIAQSVLDGSSKQKRSRQREDFGRNTHAAFVILLQSLNALGRAEVSKHEFEDLGLESSILEAEKAFYGCLTTFKEYTTGKTSTPLEAKMEYLSCLKQLVSLYSDPRTRNTRRPKKPNVEQLKEEIKRIELEIPSRRTS